MRFQCCGGCFRSACAVIVVSVMREAKRPLGLGESADDLVVEYDEGVLRSLKERDDFI